MTLDDPAINVMTDLQSINAVVIQPRDNIEEANKRMIQCGLRLLLVIDHARKVEGMITATDILGGKPMRVVAERRCKTRGGAGARDHDAETRTSIDSSIWATRTSVR